MAAKEISYRAVCAVAAQYGYKSDPHAYARELMAREPQLWAYDVVQDEMRADGFRVTQGRKDAIWAALGGK